MPLTDEEAAQAAIATIENLSLEQVEAFNAINIILRDGRPFVDVHELFAHYNVLYFRKLLLPRVEVLWSPRLTLCAGICELSKDDTATRKLGRIRLKLSTPLLQYRPRSDTINTLLHEAIHAYFFVTISWRHARDDDGSGHGIGFQLMANAINHHGKHQVTIYHTFHDEVNSFRTHVWRCNGLCQSMAPDFGLVKRSMNRPPGKSDVWWQAHEIECGGSYTKIQEPAPTKKQLDAMSARDRAGRQKNKLDSWMVVGVKPVERPEPTTELIADDKSPVSLQRSLGKLKEISIKDMFASGSNFTSSAASKKRSRNDEEDEYRTNEKNMLVECPVCTLRIGGSQINEHLDVEHPP